MQKNQTNKKSFNILNQNAKPDYWLFIFATTLIAISIIYSYSLSVYTVLNFEYNQFHFFLRQLIVGITSIFIMWGLAQFNPNTTLKLIGFGLFFTFLLLMLVMPFLPSSMVTASGGANRWIRLPGFSLSPVEFFKIGFIYFLAWSFYRRLLDKPKKMKLLDEILLLAPYFGVFGIVVILVAFLQKDLGQIVLLGVVLFIMMIFANRSFKIFMILGAVGASLITILIIVAPHRINRIQSWWSMVQDGILIFLPSWAEQYLRVKEFPEPYQVGHSLNAISNGGLSGTGMGDGFLKLGFLSEVHTDFVLAGITEEAGFFGLFIIVSLIMLVVWRIFKISARVKDPIFHLFTLGIGLMIAIAFLINAFGISGIFPIKGIAVPFLSYGGSALLAMSICIGLVLSISSEVKDEPR